MTGRGWLAGCAKRPWLSERATDSDPSWTDEGVVPRPTEITPAAASGPLQRLYRDAIATVVTRRVLPEGCPKQLPRPMMAAAPDPSLINVGMGYGVMGATPKAASRLLHRLQLETGAAVVTGSWGATMAIRGAA